jgi:hypothetical protein
MVLGGRIDVVGSARGRVLDAIELLKDHAAAAGPELTIADDRLSVGPGQPADAAIWLVGFDDRHDVALERGEARGTGPPAFITWSAS